MKVNLIVPTDGPLPTAAPTPVEQAMLVDTQLRPLATRLAQGDEGLERGLLFAWCHPVVDQAALAYRQATVADARHDPHWAQQLYTLSCQVITKLQRDSWRFPDGSATYQLYSQSSALETYLTGVAALAKLPFTGSSPAGKAFSGELTRLFTSTNLAAMRQVTAACRLATGYSYPVALAGDLGSQPHDLDYRPTTNRLATVGRALLTHHRHHPFEIPERDDNAANALGHDENLAAGSAATILYNATHEFAIFFEQLRYQSGLLVAICRYQQLLGTTATTNLVIEPTTTITGLKNVQLLLAADAARPVVANDLHAAAHQAVVISGANQGGKTTFLRAWGQAQVLGQAGFPVAATRFACPAYRSVVTHFRREEDPTEHHGKLDEELVRLQAIVSHLPAPSLLLMNESFSSTNEHEGALINDQIIRGLLHNGHAIGAVTHQYELGQRLATLQPHPLFLRAERLPSGERPFKLMVGQPQLTSYGLDLFDRLFSDGAPSPA